jgi:photosystem II stability/assembly factor-like uncharacterized protein
MKTLIAIIIFLNTLTLFGQWTESTSIGSFFEVAYPDTSAAYITGDFGIVNKSIDGGVSWSQIYDFGPFSSLSDPQFINADTGFVSANGGVYRTLNGGSAWSPISSNWTQQNGTTITRIKIANERIFSSYVNNDTTYFLSSDSYGTNWTIIFQNYEINAQPYTYSMVDSLNGHFINPNELEQVLVTNNGGLSFIDTLQITNGPIVLQAKYDFIDMQNGYSYGTSGSFSHPTRTWNTGTFYFPIDLDGFGVLPILDLDYNTSKLYAASIYGKIFYSINKGQSWVEQSTPTSNTYPIMSISFANETHGIAVAGNGVIYTKNSSISAGINDKTINNKIIIFPNPAKDVINIESLNNIEFIEISLYNSEGQLVKHFETSERSLDINNTPAGQYFLSIKTVNESITKKIIIK